MNESKFKFHETNENTIKESQFLPNTSPGLTSLTKFNKVFNFTKKLLFFSEKDEEYICGK